MNPAGGANRRGRSALAALMTIRVSLRQMLLITGVSAAVTLMVVVSSLGETASERAVIAALRTGQVVHAPASGRFRILRPGRLRPRRDPLPGGTEPACRREQRRRRLGRKLRWGLERRERG